MKRKIDLALLCDYGLDDAVATAYILKHSDSFGKIDILPIGGNFPRQEALVNAKRLLWTMKNEGVALHQVRIVDTAAVAQPEERLVDIHGSDGMGDVLAAEFEETVPVMDYGRWLEEVDEGYIIVSLGPCTVTQDILRRKGRLPMCLMCGNIAQPPNYNGYEFNHGMNKAAFAECVQHPHFAATLDTCHIEKCDITGIALDGGDTLCALMRRYRELSQSRKEPACYVYDLTVAVWLVHPERFATEVMMDSDGNQITVLRYISNEMIV